MWRYRRQCINIPKLAPEEKQPNQYFVVRGVQKCQDLFELYDAYNSVPDLLIWTVKVRLFVDDIVAEMLKEESLKEKVEKVRQELEDKTLQEKSEAWNKRGAIVALTESINHTCKIYGREKTLETVNLVLDGIESMEPGYTVHQLDNKLLDTLFGKNKPRVNTS
jgi:hypothetical protein